MSLEYKILGQDLVSYTDTTELVDTTSYYVSYEETITPMFVAVAYNSNTVVYSTDGITWTQTTSPVSAVSVTHGDGKFVAVDTGSTAAYSTDGISWTQTTLPVSAGWRSVTYGDGKFVAVSTSSKAVYSTDGISWTQTTMPGDDWWYSVTYGDGKFVAPANNSSRAAYSTDGITWTQTAMPTSARWYSVTRGDGKFVAVSTSSKVVYSTDGISWTQTTMPVSANWYSVTHGEALQLTETLNIIGGQGTSESEEFLPVTIYTVPEGKQTTVTSVYVANHDESESTYDFAVVPAGEELSLKHHIRWDMPVAGKDFEVINTKITMSAGDSLVIFPSTVDTVSVTAFGVEK